MLYIIKCILNNCILCLTANESIFLRVPLASSLRRLYIYPKKMLPIDNRRTFKHAFWFMCVWPGDLSTRHTWRLTCIHATRGAWRVYTPHVAPDVYTRHTWRLTCIHATRGAWRVYTPHVAPDVYTRHTWRLTCIHATRGAWLVYTPHVAPDVYTRHTWAWRVYTPHVAPDVYTRHTWRLTCIHATRGAWLVYTQSFLGVHGVTDWWPRTKGTANNERVHSFCWSLPIPFIQDPFLWPTSKEFVKTDLYPLSQGFDLSPACRLFDWALVDNRLGVQLYISISKLWSSSGESGWSDDQSLLIETSSCTPSSF